MTIKTKEWIIKTNRAAIFWGLTPTATITALAINGTAHNKIKKYDF